MNSDEKEAQVLFFQAMDTLAELNVYFVENETLTKDKFMELQLNIWKMTKDVLNIDLKKTQKKKEKWCGE